MKASIGFRISFQKVEPFALFPNTQCSFPHTNELLFIMVVFSSADITVIIVFIIDGMVDVIFFLPLFLLHIVKIVHPFYFPFFFQLLPDLIYQNLNGTLHTLIPAAEFSLYFSLYICKIRRYIPF